MGPQLYLMLALALSGPVTYGVMWVKRERAVAVAYDKGHKAGAGSVAATVTEKASNTVAAVDAGEREAPAVSADRQKLIELCKKSASCRDRHKINGGT